MSLENILKKLIALRTVTDDRRENDRAFRWILGALHGLPLFARRFSSRGYDSVLLTTRKTTKPKVLLAAHIDVVPGSSRVFHPTVLDGKLYGRGACDMKFAVACYIKLCRELNTSLPRHDLGIMLTSDEEVGGMDGTRYILFERGIRSRVVLLPDGGFDWQIETKAKGALQIELISKGKSAHSSRPWEGENSLAYLVEFLHDLSRVFPSDECCAGGHYHDTMTISKISGGEAGNQIPAEARAFIDIRHVPETNKAALWKKIRRVLQHHSSVKAREAVYGYPNSVNLANPHLRLFMNFAKELHGIKMQPASSHGSSDARFFAQKKIPALLTRPVSGGHHTEREWISLASLAQFYEVMKAWVVKLSGN